MVAGFGQTITRDYPEQQRVLTDILEQASLSEVENRSKLKKLHFYQSAYWQTEIIFQFLIVCKCLLKVYLNFYLKLTHQSEDKLTRGFFKVKDNIKRLYFEQAACLGPCLTTKFIQ